MWGGTLASKPISIPAGEYKLIITARGEPSANEFPHIIIKIDDQQVGNYYVSKEMKDQNFLVKINSTAPVVIQITMTNDHYIPGKSDRNIYLKQLLFERMGEKLINGK